MSARRPGSSRFSMTTMTSGIKTLPRLTIRSICSLTVRMTASALERGARSFGLGDLVDAHGIVGFGLDIAGDLRFRETLHENLDPLIRQLQHAHDDADCADRMDIVGSGILDVQGLLRRQEDHPVAGQCRFDRLDRHLAADKQRQDHVGKDDDVADGQQRELVGDLDVLRRLSGLVRSIRSSELSHDSECWAEYICAEMLRLDSAGAAMIAG